MSATTRSRALFAALLLGLFAAGGVVGYVYRYAPLPEVVSTRVTPAATPQGPRVIGGTIAAIEGDRLTLATSTGPITLALPPGVAVDQLARATSGLAAGTAVNVGVQSTQYGLALTGIVGIEAAR